MGLRFAARVERYEEQIRVLRRLWTERVVTEMTEHHSIDRAGIAPLPIQRPIPIWLGGGAHPRVLERVGRLADGWMAHEPRAGARFESALAAIHESAERAGRDPATIGVQGRIAVHGQADLDRSRHALDARREPGITHPHITAPGPERRVSPPAEVLQQGSERLPPHPP